MAVPAPGRVEGKVALVTGGGGGIGQATAQLLWEQGASVVLADVDAEAAERAAAEISADGQRLLAVGARLDEEPEAQAVVAQAVSRFGRLDVLANVAGVRVWGPITEADTESWDYILRGNLLQVGASLFCVRPAQLRRSPLCLLSAVGGFLRRSTAGCSKFAVREMARNGGGSVVNVSSANAVSGRSGMAQYDATKAALLALTRAMAHDHAGDGVRVNAVCPGPTLTMFHVRRRAAATGETLEQARAELAKGTPTLLRRQADPREIGPRGRLRARSRPQRTATTADRGETDRGRTRNEQ